MREELQKKVERSIRLLKRFDNKDIPVEVAYSGGKDSDVILQLVKESGINYRAIYKNTTIDPPGTIKHVKEMGVEILQPEKNFFQIMEYRGLPNRFKRFCCKDLKEYKVLDKAVMGVRRSESSKRAERYKEPTECKFYGSKKNHVEAIYPILEWTNEDVEEYLKDRQIKCAPIYYDEEGNFHVDRRLGCMCCPLANKKKRIEQFKMWPKMLKAYVRHAQNYIDNHPDGAPAKTYSSVYEWLVRDIFYCDNPKEWESLKGSMFEQPNFKSFLEEYFGIVL